MARIVLSLRLWWLTGSILLAATWLFAGVPVVAQGEEQVPPSTPDRAFGQVGAQIYITNCAPCHGDDGAGNGPVLQDRETNMVDFRDPTVLASGRSPVQWQQVTSEGRIEFLMPPWQNQLSEEQMWDVVAYLWQLSTSADELARGTEVWQLLDFESDQLDPGQHALALSLEEWQAGFAQKLTEESKSQLSEEAFAAVYRNLQSRVLTPGWKPLLREGRGTLSVLLQPLSPGMTLPPDLPMLLRAQVGHLQAGEWESPTAGANPFAFRDLDTSSRLSYVAEVEWEDLAFQSEPFSFASGEEIAEVEVDVFAVSSTQAAIAINKLQILLALAEDSILIGQQALAANSLPYVFTGRLQEDLKEPVTVEIPLFPGAIEVTLAEEDGTRFEVGENRVYDKSPLFPLPTGTWSTLGYGLPLPEAGDSWVQSWPYPTSNISVLVPQGGGLQVEIPGFERSGTREIGGVTHDIWHAAALPNGKVEIQFSEVPAGVSVSEALPAVQQMPTWLPWSIAAFLTLLLIFFTVFASGGTRHRRRNVPHSQVS